MKNSPKQKNVDQKAIAWLTKYLRYTDYIGAAQLYLKDNCLMREPLKVEHIKDRILGHWGTVPGLNFIYAHLNYLISKHKTDTEDAHTKNPHLMFIAGPGHGAPAVIANLFAENALAEFYPELQRDEKGTTKLIRMFSWPGGFPSHTNPGTPGAIVEGGELGYSLATAFGAVMDNPDLIVACVVGDGEAETGPMAAAWNSNKFLNPAESGAVLPILHANGYKITGPTIYATMSDQELINLFSGYGYEPFIVDDTDPNQQNHQAMIDTLELAYQKIRAIQKKARNQKEAVLKPRWPMIVYRSIKGRTGIKHADGHKVEGTYHSHGIPIGDPKTNSEHFKLIKNWLESYKFPELVDKKGQPLPEILEFVPKKSARGTTRGANKVDSDSRMGMCKDAIGGNVRKKLNLPNLEKFAIELSKKSARGQILLGNTLVGSDYIAEIFKLNQKEKNFRFMCPDETESNKFTSLFKATKRAFMWPINSYDENLSPSGRVMEILSEHTIQGWLQGYVLTGRHGMFATYEAFATIVSSMVDQYAKFLKLSSKVPWRTPVSSLNYLLTSVGWRQEHNGYSHQNPSFISNLLEKHGKFCSVYLPADANSLLVTLEDCFKRTNSINAIVVNKNPLPQWLTLEEAREELKNGLGIWEWINAKMPGYKSKNADQDPNKNPDVVMAASGDALVIESLAAISILHKIAPELKLRFVNVSELTSLGIGDERHPLSVSDRDFNKYFTEDKPIIYNFHGYPATIRKLIYGHQAMDRFSIHGYNEEGTTTTPFNMMVLNKTDRFNLAIDALKKAAKQNSALAKKAPKLIRQLEAKLAEHAKYIVKYGKDMSEIEGWRWN